MRWKAWAGLLLAFAGTSWVLAENGSVEGSATMMRGERAPIAVESIAGSQLSFAVRVPYDRAILRVVGPGHYVSRAVFAKGEPISAEIRPQPVSAAPDRSRRAPDRAPAALELQDGMYRYELILIDRSSSPRERSLNGLFFVEAGAPVSRDRKRGELAAVRREVQRPTVHDGDPEPLTLIETDWIQINDVAGDGTNLYMATNVVPGTGNILWDIESKVDLLMTYRDFSGPTDLARFAMSTGTDLGIGTHTPTHNVHMFPPLEAGVVPGSTARYPEIYMYTYFNYGLGSGITRGWEIGANDLGFWIEDRGNSGLGTAKPLRILGDAPDSAVVIEQTRIRLSSDLSVPSGEVTTAGVRLASSRASKEKVVPVDPAAILASLESVPVSEWSFKNDEDGARHIGPMAEDFHQAFELEGQSPEHLSVTDVQGVTLAAIQALSDKLGKLESENAELRARLERLEAEPDGD